jgi:dipeptidase D
MGVENLEPRECFKWFAELSRIPRGSRHEQRISDYLVGFATDRKLSVTRDALGNVCIKKPGQGGLEKAPAVILQGHSDMVWVKDEGCDFDFSTEGINILTDGEAVTADRTTLGADNGVALSFIMALLDSGDIPHPPLEAVITTQEEVGMGGAAAFDATQLSASYFINIDSEEEGIFCASCAGGRRSTMTLPLEKTVLPDAGRYAFHTVSVGGLSGGHSGMDIHRERGNSNRLLGRVLEDLADKFEVYLVSVKGGTASNVIPADSSAVVAVNAGEADIKAELARWTATLKNELKAADGAGLKITLGGADRTAAVLSGATFKKALAAMLLIPHGVVSMDRNMTTQSLVESSNNFATMETTDDAIIFTCASRSSVGSKKAFIYDQIRLVAGLIGAEISYFGDYPAWEYHPQSKIRDLFATVYKELFGKEAKVEGIHAGLECGLFSEKFKAMGRDMDFIAFGPDITGAHSTKETLSRSSAANMWKLLKESLKRMGDLR